MHQDEAIMRLETYGTCNYAKHCFFKDLHSMCHFKGDCKYKGELG